MVMLVCLDARLSFILTVDGVLMVEVPFRVKIPPKWTDRLPTQPDGSPNRWWRPAFAEESWYNSHMPLEFLTLFPFTWIRMEPSRKETLKQIWSRLLRKTLT